MLASLYRSARSLTAMFRGHEAYLSSDINERDSWEKHSEVMHRLIDIYGRHGGCFLRNHSLFLSSRDIRASTQSSYITAQHRVQQMSTSEQKNSPLSNVLVVE